jgi:hypothetical protein
VAVQPPVPPINTALSPDAARQDPKVRARVFAHPWHQAAPLCVCVFAADRGFCSAASASQSAPPPPRTQGSARGVSRPRIPCRVFLPCLPPHTRTHAHPHTRTRARPQEVRTFGGVGGSQAPSSKRTPLVDEFQKEVELDAAELILESYLAEIEVRCSGAGDLAWVRCSGAGDLAWVRCSGAGDLAWVRCSGAGDLAWVRCGHPRLSHPVLAARCAFARNSGMMASCCTRPRTHENSARVVVVARNGADRMSSVPYCACALSHVVVASRIGADHLASVRHCACASPPPLRRCVCVSRRLGGAGHHPTTGPPAGQYHRRGAPAGAAAERGPQPPAAHRLVHLRHNPVCDCGRDGHGCVLCCAVLQYKGRVRCCLWVVHPHLHTATHAHAHAQAPSVVPSHAPLSHRPQPPCRRWRCIA